MYLNTNTKILIIVIILFLIFFYVIPSGLESTLTRCSRYEHADNLDKLSGTFSNEALQAIASVYSEGSGGFSNLDVTGNVVANAVDTGTLTSTPGTINAIKPVNIKNGLIIVDKICSDANTCLTSAQFGDLINYAKIPTTMYSRTPGDYIMYENIFDAWNKGIIVDYNGGKQDITSYKTNFWKGTLPMLRLSTVIDEKNGVTITVPDKMKVIWLRAYGGNWLKLDVQNVRKIADGMRMTGTLIPNGSVDRFNGGGSMIHKWVPIAVPGPGKYNIVVMSGGDPWISGLAFSTNPWNHAMSAAIGYYWKMNGGSDTSWSQNWNSIDNIFILNSRGTYTLNVPVINSGKDKLFYVVAPGQSDPSGFGSFTLTSVTVAGINVGTLTQGYKNPFSDFFNSIQWGTFFAVKFPAASVTSNGTVAVTLEIPYGSMYIREAGTIDYLD